MDSSAAVVGGGGLGPGGVRAGVGGGGEHFVTCESEGLAIGPAGGNPDGRGPASGYQYGETEDYLLQAEDPCLTFWP